MKRINSLLSFLIFLICINSVLAQGIFPGNHWLQYENVNDAGFLPEKLKNVKAKFDSTAAASLLVIYKGRVLISFGDNTRRFMAHSIRKSFMSALYGVYINNGKLNLNTSLQALNIDEISPLTAEEKQATIRDLLSARSGIYLPAAYSPKGMAKNLPARGSHTPGSHWYYNNWDFNVLSTIFEEQIGNKVFEDFYQKIAQPLGMEDFRIRDGHYLHEPEKSQHSAYLFNISARDLARFGWLYLNRGKWNNQQLIPEKWVEESTSKISNDLGTFSNRGSYGYLWWVSEDFSGQKMFYASGIGGHRLFVLPESEMVIVHRVNTYERKAVANHEIMGLLKQILDAKKYKGIDQPTTIAFSPPTNIPQTTYTLDPTIATTYLGDYKHPFLGYFTIQSGKEGLELRTNIGIFRLFALDQNQFFPEDLETKIEFKPTTSEEKKRTIEPIFGPGRSLQQAIFYY